MATVLFINRTDLVRNSILDGNVDTDKFIQFIKISQQINIQNYLGSQLYNKYTTIIGNGDIDTAPYLDYKTLLNEYIQPMLIWFAQVDYLPFAAYQVKNGGVFKHTSENASNAEKFELDALIEKHRDTAEHYTQRMIDYLTNNSNSFTEYTSNSNEDMSPDKDTNFSGWYL